MALTNVGISPQRVQPFLRRDDSDAIGQMFGVLQQNGDGSGGNHTLGFLLPGNNVYLIRWCRVSVVSGTSVSVSASLGLGIQADGLTLAWNRTELVPSAVGVCSQTFEPARLIVLPDIDASINVQVNNVNGRTLTWQMSTVYWARQAFIDMPSERFSTFL